MTESNEPEWLVAWKNGGQANQPVLPDDPPRRPDGTFPPGVSGNRAGMRKGTKHTRTQLADALKENGAALLQVAIDKALAGDTAALTLCLSRLVPVLKPKGERVQFALDIAKPRHEQCQQIVAAVAAGELDVDAGKLLIDCITAAANLCAVDELEARLAALEARGSSEGRRAGVVISREGLPE